MKQCTTTLKEVIYDGASLPQLYTSNSRHWLHAEYKYQGLFFFFGSPVIRIIGILGTEGTIEVIYFQASLTYTLFVFFFKK